MRSEDTTFKRSKGFIILCYLLQCSVGLSFFWSGGVFWLLACFPLSLPSPDCKEPFSDKPVWNLGKREFKRHEGLQNKVPHGVVLTQTLCLTDSSYQGKAIQLGAQWFTSHTFTFSKLGIRVTCITSKIIEDDLQNKGPELKKVQIC